MKASDRSTAKALLGVAGYMAGLACLLVGWVALLAFPWSWVVVAVAVLEAAAILLVVSVEYASRRVDGAAGWMTFAYLMGHIWLFTGAAALRLGVWLWQLWVA
jgi:hypothetical protein